MFESDTKSISRKILKENDTVTKKIEAKFLEVRPTVIGHDHSERNITLKKKNLNEIRNVQKETWGEGGLQRHVMDKNEAISETIKNENRNVNKNIECWDRNEKVRDETLYKKKQFGNIFKGQKTLIEERAETRKVHNAHLIAGKDKKIS